MEDLKKSVARIEEKLDKVIEDQSQIKVIQASQAADLKHHIARTDASEHRIQTVEDKLLPLIEIKHKFDGAFKLIGMCGTGLGLIFAAVKAVETVLKML